MVHRFAKVSEEKIEEAFFYSSDLVNTKTTIPLRVSEEWWIYTSTLHVSVYIHHYSPPLRGIVLYYTYKQYYFVLSFSSVSNIQYCAKVMRANFDKIHLILTKFAEIVRHFEESKFSVLLPYQFPANVRNFAWHFVPRTTKLCLKFG